TRAYAAYEHYKLGTVDWPVSATILLGAVPGNIVAAMFVNRYVARLGDNAAVLVQFQHNLKIFVAFVLLATTIIMASPILFGDIVSSIRLPDGKVCRRISGVLVGAVIGGLVGMTSIGGGVLLIPALVVLFGLRVDKTVGSSVLVSVVLVLVSTLIYGGDNQIDYPTAVTMFAGSICGVFIGSRAMVRVSDRAVLVMVLVLMMVAVATMFVGIVR
ncbi:MAG: sulfite exporter TauE/SafE family protein, partial [Candidatus Hydrogenedentes bacterium]|nr:sulfite exporter TauE/SafE family protein [Candidatus Hydrogenedentota bacterium]